MRSLAGDGVEGDEELAGDGHEGELGRLAGLAQSLIERRERGVEAGSGHRGQVEHGADRGAASADASGAAERSAIAGEGSDADERRDLAPSQVTELGQIDQQRAGDAGSDTRDGLEEREKFRAFGALPQRGIDLSLEIADELRERSQHAIEVW